MNMGQEQPAKNVKAEVLPDIWQALGFNSLLSVVKV